MEHVILGIDPGNKSSGIVILVEGVIQKGDNLENEKMFSLIDEYTLFSKDISLTVVYEDIRPFTSRFNMDTIDTIKVIGRLEYVLNQRRVSFKAVTRNEVKSYVFKEYNNIAYPIIEGKVAKSVNKKKDGSDRKPSFVYVDDRIVEKAMKLHWGINVVNGKRHPSGIRKHAWQALGAVTCYIFSMPRL